MHCPLDQLQLFVFLQIFELEMDEHPCPSGVRAEVGAGVSGVGEGGVGGGSLLDMQTLFFPDQVQRIASLHILRSRTLHGWSQYSGTKEIHSIIGESSPVGF